MRPHGQPILGQPPSPRPSVSVGVANKSGRRPRVRLPVGDLVDLAIESFHRGHYKVALRRAYMVQASGRNLPGWLLILVRKAEGRCRARELAAMKAAADDWATMVRASTERASHTLLMPAPCPRT